jgi:hypothetical protein
MASGMCFNELNYKRERGIQIMGLIGIGGLLLLGGIYLVFAFIWWLLQIIANWNIFTKAGEAGWKSIIPVYSDYISYKIAWQPSYFWLVFVLGIITSVANGMADPNETNTTILLIVSLIRIILAIISILYCIKLSRAFGHGIGFAIGLIFLQPIFMLILGFGNDPYYGADR